VRPWSVEISTSKVSSLLAAVASVLTMASGRNENLSGEEVAIVPV